MNEGMKDTIFNNFMSNNQENYILDTETKRLYRKGKRIGGGGFGEVFEFIDNETGEIKAAKIISLKKLENPQSNESYYNEYKFNNTLNYKYICKCYSTFKDNQNAYFILEYHPNKTLSDLIKNRYSLTEIEVKHYCYELLLAIEYLHSRNIIHRDIKLSNVLLSDKMEVKLCDFGLAIENRSENNKTVCGTPNYIAPEIFNYKNYINYTFETDIWSFGIILYSLFFHKTPFESPVKGKTKKNIQNVIYSFPQNNEVNENAKNLMRKIFVKEPSERPSIKEIKESPFFNNGKGIPKYLPSSTKNVKLFEEELENFVNEAIINDECLDKEFITDPNYNLNGPLLKYNNSYNENNVENDSEEDSDKYNSSEKDREEEIENEKENDEEKNMQKFERKPANKTKSVKMRELKKIKVDKKLDISSLKYTSKKIKNNNLLNDNENVNDNFEILKKKQSKFNNDNQNINNDINNNKIIISPNKETNNSKEYGKLSNFNSFGKINDDTNNETDIKKRNIDSFHPCQDTNDNNRTISKDKNIETFLSDVNNFSKNISINSNFSSSKKIHFRNNSNDIFFHHFSNKCQKKEYNLITQNKNVDDIVVLKFIDLSNKCGIGYILSNGDIGALFNDKTKLIIIKPSLKIIYIDSKGNVSQINFEDKIDLETIKKLKILSLFHKKFTKNKRNSDFNLNPLYEKQTLDVYVTKWTKTHKASFFLLSNKEIQVIFNDKTQVIFNLKNKTVLFINHLKQKFKQDMRLNDFSSFEMTIRVIYAKKLLAKL